MHRRKYGVIITSSKKKQQWNSGSFKSNVSVKILWRIDLTISKAVKEPKSKIEKLSTTVPIYSCELVFPLHVSIALNLKMHENFLPTFLTVPPDYNFQRTGLHTIHHHDVNNCHSV
jgi:hypothetical protein